MVRVECDVCEIDASGLVKCVIPLSKVAEILPLLRLGPATLVMSPPRVRSPKKKVVRKALATNPDGDGSKPIQEGGSSDDEKQPEDSEGIATDL